MWTAKRGEKETKTDDKKQAITIKHAEGETKLDKPAKKLLYLSGYIQKTY